MSSSVIEKAFGKDVVVTLSNGSKIRLGKWSVRKGMAMGASIAKVIGEIVGLLEKKTSDTGEVQVADIISLIPTVMETCANELTFIIIESSTTPQGEKQLTKDDVLDRLTLDDFVDLLSSIIEMNITEKSMGKWKRLLTATPIGK